VGGQSARTTHRPLDHRVHREERASGFGIESIRNAGFTAAMSIGLVR
jgi:hypothetical protein